MYVAPGRGRQPPGDKILMSTERPYHFTHLLQVSKKSLWSLILYNFFHDLIHVYSLGARGIQSRGDKVLMSTETSCHFGHLLLVSYHRRQWFLKNPLFYLFPIQKHKGPNWTCRKIGQGQPRVIIWANLVILKHPMMHTKIQGHRPSGSGEEVFFLAFYHIWAWRPSWSSDLDHLSKLSFPHP